MWQSGHVLLICECTYSTTRSNEYTFHTVPDYPIGLLPPDLELEGEESIGRQINILINTSTTITALYGAFLVLAISAAIGGFAALLYASFFLSNSGGIGKGEQILGYTM